MKKYVLYTNKKIPKEIDFFYLNNKEQISIAFQNYNPKLHIITETKFINPILDNDNIREMNDDELAIYEKRKLREGEKIVNGALIKTTLENSKIPKLKVIGDLDENFK